MQFVHVDISVTVNEEARSWGDPHGRETISFSVPADLFDSKKISNIFPQLVKVAESKFELAQAEEKLESEESEE